MKILVLSCDKNKDLFTLFHHCIEKYWPDHPEIIYCTESIDNKFYKTIHKNYPLNKWTRRVKESVTEIDDQFILLMCDDIFIRSKVNNEKIDILPAFFAKDTAAINFENNFDKNDLDFHPWLKKRPKAGRYKTSMMFQLWKKDNLLKVLSDIETDPWTFEQMNNHLDLIYLVNSDPHKGLIDFGKVDRIYNWGIVQGKWTQECLDFFAKEGIKINPKARGIIDAKLNDQDVRS